MLYSEVCLIIYCCCLVVVVVWGGVEGGVWRWEGGVEGWWMGGGLSGEGDGVRSLLERE